MKPALMTSWLGLCIMVLVPKTVHPVKVDREREETQTRGREKSS